MENYTIYDEIGRGTHSFVYKARRKRSIEYVAVKSTAKTRMEKILNEVQILHRLDSRYVLKFYNWYESQNHIWLIFEYCIGGDLLNLITQDRLLPAPAVRTFGWELVAGLRYLHTNGILYCDLKPANILIDECGSLKLADFGLARRIPTAESMAGRQLAPGSPNYMAPELFQPAAIHSYASDFWALGCVLYELCTGRPPFTHTFFPELARIIQNEPLMIPVEGYEISTSFADLLERLLEKDPYQRITWDELLAHPFWSGCEPLDEAPLPPQELFEASRPEAEELPTESLSISIQDHEGPSMPAESMLSRGRESSATETASDGSNTSHQDESSVEKPLRDDDESLSESESDSQDEIVHEVVGTRPVRPVTAPALLDVGSRRLSHRKNKEDISTEQSVPRMKTAPSSGTNLKRGLLVRQMSPSRKAPLIKASRLLFVADDATVKPIAFCGDIETVPTPPVHSDDLEFEPLSSDNLLSCTTEDLEYHLKSVYINLKSTELTAADKNNVLAHLFSLSLTPKLANVILNSSLLTLLVRMLRQSHLPLTPGGVIDTSASSMIMLVLGVLFRLGTFISTPSPEHVHNLVSSLSYFLTNNPPAINPMTRRRAAACLGELLFYLAAQQNGGLVPAGASTIVRAMEDADSIVKHYAIRTVTNILARGADDSVHVGLVHEQTVLALARCLASLNAADDESLLLKTSTVQAIAQLFRQLRLSTDRARSLTRTKLSLLTALSKNSLLASLWRGAASGHASPELATASLNVLNCYLELSARKDIDEAPNDVIMKHKQVLLEKLVDMAELSRLLEVRSKYEDDDQLEQNDVIDADLSPNNADATTNESRRRYNTEDRAAPTLLRAKAILFVHFGILHSMVFARQCVRTQVVDKIETSLSPFSSILRSHLASPAKVKSDAPVVASPRQLPPLDHYVLQCGQNVVCVCIRSALKMSAECISSTNTIAYEDDDSATGQPFTSVVASEPFQLFEQLIKNATCCSQLCYLFLVNEGKEFRYFIRLMSKLLTSFASETLAAMGSTVGTVISRLLLRLFQSSSTDAAALVATEPVELFTYLLPAVVVQLLHPRETGDDHLEDDEDDDHSANCIQLVYLIMLHLDYDLNQTAMVERDRFVEDHLMPCFRVLLGTTRQNENVWRFALELLHGLVTRDALMTATLTPQGLVGPILALLSAPVRLEYHSLPSNATALVREVVEMHKKSHSLGSLYAHDIARHVNAGLERMVHWGTFNSGTVHLLEVLYILLFHRYDERRKTSDATPPPPEFDDLVECGPSLLQICAHADDDVADEEPQGSPRTVNHAAVVHLEVLDAGSRCLIFLSQIFGARLNAVFFGSSTSKASKDEVARCLITCLQSHHDRVLHHVLLTIKNALRCDKNSDTAYARRWLQSDKAAMAEIVRVSKRRVSPSTNRDVKATAAQVVKTASEIVTHLQNA